MRESQRDLLFLGCLGDPSQCDPARRALFHIQASIGHLLGAGLLHDHFLDMQKLHGYRNAGLKV